MNKIIWEDIENDKNNLLMLIGQMSIIYKEHQKHIRVLECNQWITMLNRRPLNSEYTTDAILCLKNIINDSVNFLATNYQIDNAKIGLRLYGKICNLFNRNINKV